MNAIAISDSKELHLKKNIEAVLLRASSYIGEAVLHIKKLEGDDSEMATDLIRVRHALIDISSEYI